MRRLGRFRRDFEELHGRDAWAEAEVIRHEDVRAGRIVTRMDSPGVRLVAGALGLFWALVIGGALIAMLVWAWALLTSLGAPSLPS